MSTLHVTGGRVLRPDFTVERADVLVDQNEGVILDVGDVSRGEKTIDASDGLVMPGLVNAHTHVAMTLLRGYADDKPLDRWLREDIWPVEAALEAEDVRVGTELGTVEMIRSGTTTFADMYFFEPTVAAVVERAGLRARLGHGVVSAGKDDEAARADFEEGLSVASELVGLAEGRVTTAVCPHSLTTVDESHLTEYIPRARNLGVPVHFHANETRDEVAPFVEAGQRPLEYADDLGMLTEGDFLAHGVHLDQTEIDLLARRGTAVIHCPASNMKLASGLAPVQRLLDAGVTVGLGTDGAASNNDLDMFGEMRDAAMVGKVAADDARAVSAPKALKMATAGGAEALGIPAGRLEVGALADLIVVDLSRPHLVPDHDAVSNLVYAARGSDVRHTICDGQVLMRNREVLPLDVPAIRAEAANRAERAVDRAA